MGFNFTAQFIAKYTPTNTLVWAAGIRKHEEPQHRHYAREVNVEIELLERV